MLQPGAEVTAGTDARMNAAEAVLGPALAMGRGGAPARTDVPSPDGRRTAFIRDWNLWVRDLATKKETALTTDGVQDFGYATDNAGWAKSDRPILVWSPDSKKIATFQQDQRKVGEMYLVNTTAGHPTLQAWKYPLPGDEVVSMIHRVVIDVDAREVERNGESVELSALEFDLLVALARTPGRVLTRRQLLEKVWGYDFFGDERVVDVHVRSIRKALGDNAEAPEVIGTVRGVGYKFVAARL